MKKYLCLMLACLVALAPMALAEVDENVVATVKGTPITRDVMQEEYDYYVQLYASYGITDEDSLGMVKDSIIMTYVTDVVLEKKVKELGIEVPTDEELQAAAVTMKEEPAYDLLTNYSYAFYAGEGDAEAAAAAFVEYYSQLENVGFYDALASFGETDADNKAILDEAMVEIEAYLVENGYTDENLLEYQRSMTYNEAAEAYITKDLVVTEEDVLAYYDENVETAKSVYDEDPAALERAVQQGAEPLYYPEGYRYIKHILVLMDEQDQNDMYYNTDNADTYREQIADLDGVTPMDAEEYTSLSQRKGEISLRLSEINGLLANEDADIDALTAEQEALTAEQAEVDAKLESDEAVLYNAQTNLAVCEENIAAIQAKYQDKVDAIYERLNAGEDFTALVAELGEDPGMLDGNGNVKPYMVYEQSDGVWVDEFAAACRELEEGKYTESPVWTTYGAHIVYYEAAVPAGAVDFESVKDRMTQECTDEKRSELISSTLEAWVAECDVVTYPQNLVSSGAQAEAE